MNAVKEIWKDVPGFENLYQVSNHGRLKSFARYKNSKQKERILKIRISREGYGTVVLSRNSTPKYVSIHRLTMLAFIGPSDLHVNHKDENKLNNHIENLEYVTPRYNRIYSLKKKQAASKYIGITLDKGMWVARVRVDKKRVHIGRFATEDAAHNAYIEYLKSNNIPYLTPRATAI